MSLESFRLSGIVLLQEDGSALFQHRDKKPNLVHSDMWVFPGGHCEACEDSKVCALREFKEETCYQCSDIQWLVETSYFEENKQYHLTMYCDFFDGIQKITCMEGQELQFLKRQEAGKYLIPKHLLPIWDLAIQKLNIRNKK